MTLLYSTTAGDKEVNYDYIKTLEDGEQLGARHNPRNFGSFIDLTRDALGTYGHKIVKEEYALTKDENRLFGVMSIETDLPDFNYLVGLRGSYDSSIARGLCVGTSVLVCSNLCISGNIGNASTKQTSKLDERLPYLVNDTIGAVSESIDDKREQYALYKQTQLTDEQAHDMLVKVHRSGGLSGSQLSRSIEQWHSPRFDEFLEHGKSVWRLFNACTEALKPSGNNNSNTVLWARTGLLESTISSLVH